jgi:hypothetical protein
VSGRYGREKIGESMTWSGDERRKGCIPAIMGEECFKRHAEIDGHIGEGKFWRGVIIALILAIVVQLGAFLMNFQRLTTMVEMSEKRLIALEDMFPRTRGFTGPTGPQGIQGIQGEAGKNGR